MPRTAVCHNGNHPCMQYTWCNEVDDHRIWTDRRVRPPPDELKGCGIGSGITFLLRHPAHVAFRCLFLPASLALRKMTSAMVYHDLSRNPLGASATRKRSCCVVVVVGSFSTWRPVPSSDRCGPIGAGNIEENWSSWRCNVPPPMPPPT